MTNRNAALMLTHLGVAAWGQGDLERAVQLYQGAEALQRATRDAWGLSISLGYLGLLAGTWSRHPIEPSPIRSNG
jgi:hypothetical protein